jgi:hypothetical protein
VRASARVSHTPLVVWTACTPRSVPCSLASQQPTWDSGSTSMMRCTWARFSRNCSIRLPMPCAVHHERRQLLTAPRRLPCAWMQQPYWRTRLFWWFCDKAMLFSVGWDFCDDLVEPLVRRLGAAAAKKRALCARRARHGQGAAVAPARPDGSSQCRADGRPRASEAWCPALQGRSADAPCCSTATA